MTRTIPHAILLLLILGLAAVSPAFGQDQPAKQLDINRATLEQIRSLPITEEQAETLYRHISEVDYLHSVYEIRSLPGFTQDDLDRLKPLVRIEPVSPEDEEIERIRSLYYRIEDWASTEGTNDNLVNLWLDLARDPLDVNSATYKQLSALQNVSPQDAIAIYREVKRKGIASRGELRRTPGLSGWGYYNARSFVRYEPQAGPCKLRGDFQVRFANAPFTNPTDEDYSDLLRENTLNTDDTGIQYDSWYDRLDYDYGTPSYQTKLRLRYGPHYQVGLTGFRDYGEIENNLSNYKFYASARDLDLGRLRVNSVVLGSYIVGFGQGLVMENLDYFKPRKSGFGWDKRINGVYGDISNSQEFQLHGVAADLSAYNFDAILFVSRDKKDAILNDDGTVNQMVVMGPRISNHRLIENGLNPMIDVLKETTYGGNLAYNFTTGTHLGFSFYESLYNRFFDPEFSTISDRPDKKVMADNEITSSYAMDGKFRRVYGWEFQTVVKNVSIQGEYAEMERTGSFMKWGDDPGAFIISSFIQFDNLNFLILYRNYDLAYDNPYNRAFSQYSKFKGTIFEDEYYLRDPIYGFVYDNAASPQAEQGWYVSSRYRFAEKLTSQIEYDTWRRVADNARYKRVVWKWDYRPIYPVRIKLRQKWQSRNGELLQSTDRYNIVESRFDISFRLSRYDQLSFLYFPGNIKWPPRPRFLGDPEPDGENPTIGGAASPSETIGASLKHNFSDNLSIRFGALFYNGFIWNFEEGEFITASGEASRFYFGLLDRITDRLWIKFKYAYTVERPRNYVDPRYFNQNQSPVEGDPDADAVNKRSSYFKLLLDWSW